MRPLRIVIGYRAPTTALPRFVIGSLTVHGVLLIVLLTLPSLRGSDRFPEDPVIVNLVSVAAAPRPQVNVPKPAPKVEPKVPQTETVVTPKPKPKAPPPLETAPKPEPQPQATQPVAPAPEEATAEPAPGEPAETTGDATGAVESMTVGGSEFAWYRTSVTAALYSHWRRPVLAGLSEPREVLVSLEILRDGRVSDVRITQSSGVPSLDRSALRAVQDASPLPPLPTGLTGPSLSARFVFRLFPE